MKILLVTLFFTAFLACNDKNKMKEISNQTAYRSDLKGTWKAVGIFLSDANAGICYGDKPNRDITFNFPDQLADDKIGYQFSGNGPVNQYFGKITVNSYDASAKNGKISIANLGSTKMAGSPEMMTCEQNFFTFLGEATSFEITNDTPAMLHIGKLKEANSAPRDGGTFIIFEKIQ
jgi:heat shock protein HslJ